MSAALAHRLARVALLVAVAACLASAVTGQFEPHTSYASRGGGWRVELYGDFTAVDQRNAGAIAPLVLAAVRRELEPVHGEGARFVEQTLGDLRRRYASVRAGHSVVLLPYPFRAGGGAPWGQIVELPAGIYRREIEDDKIAHRIWRGISRRIPHTPYRTRKLESIERLGIDGVRYLRCRGRFSGQGVPTLLVEFMVVPLGDRALLFQFFAGAQDGAGFWPKVSRLVASLEGAAETTDGLGPLAKVGILALLGCVAPWLLLLRARWRSRAELARLAEAEKARLVRRRARRRRRDPAPYSAAEHTAPASPQSVPEAQQVREARAEAANSGAADDAVGVTSDQR